MDLHIPFIFCILLLGSSPSALCRRNRAARCTARWASGPSSCSTLLQVSWPRGPQPGCHDNSVVWRGRRYFGPKFVSIVWSSQQWVLFSPPKSMQTSSCSDLKFPRTLPVEVSLSNVPISSSLRSEVNIELNFPPKLQGARSRLYRRRFLQVNTRLKALAEIYTMHSFARLCNLNFWSNFAKHFC